MPAPTTRQQLIDYCLRRLGSDVINVEISPDQMEDRVDDAFQFFQDYHFDGVEKLFLPHQLTSQDIANEYIPIPAPIISVTGVVPINNQSTSMNMFDIQYQMRLNDLYTFTSTSVIQYSMMQTHLSLLQYLFNAQPSITFTRHQSQLGIKMNWQEVAVGDWIIIECYRILDPDEYPDIYNDRWLKAYTTELFRRQWAENLSKHSGVALIGGTTLSGPEMWQKAQDGIEKLEEQVKNEFPLPVDFFTG